MTLPSNDPYARIRKDAYMTHTDATERHIDVHDPRDENLRNEDLHKKNPYGPALDIRPYFTEEGAFRFLNRSDAEIVIDIEHLDQSNMMHLAFVLHQNALDTAAGLPLTATSHFIADRIGYYRSKVGDSETQAGRILAFKSMLILRRRLNQIAQTEADVFNSHPPHDNTHR